MDVLNVKPITTSSPAICLDSKHGSDNGQHDACDCEDCVLRVLQKDPRNLILHTNCPYVAPHIVITPPDDGWEGHRAWLDNGIFPQNRGLLVAPNHLLNLDARASTLYAASRRNEDIILPQCIAPTRASCALFGLPRPVCSPSQLNIPVAEGLSPESHYKAVVTATSHTAPSFRSRWDSPQFIQMYERPFQWTDPAEPLLDMYTKRMLPLLTTYITSWTPLLTTPDRPPRVLIIDSENPFVAPHIVIEEPPVHALEPHHCLWDAATVNPQDEGFGYYLTVPSPTVQLVNSRLDWYGGDHNCGGTSSGAGGLNLPDGFDADSSDGASEIDSEGPCTPQWGPYELDDIAVAQDEQLLIADELTPCHRSEDDDEDDDLPPFDDWYQSIARRTLAVQG